MAKREVTLFHMNKVLFHYFCWEIHRWQTAEPPWINFPPSTAPQYAGYPRNVAGRWPLITTADSLFLSVGGSVYQRSAAHVSVAGRAPDKDNNWERRGRCLYVHRQDGAGLARPPPPRWLRRMEPGPREVRGALLQHSWPPPTSGVSVETWHRSVFRQTRTSCVCEVW